MGLRNPDDVIAELYVGVADLHPVALTAERYRELRWLVVNLPRVTALCGDKTATPVMQALLNWPELPGSGGDPLAWSCGGCSIRLCPARFSGVMSDGFHRARGSTLEERDVPPERTHHWPTRLTTAGTAAPRSSEA